MTSLTHHIRLLTLCALILLCTAATGCSDDLSQSESNQDSVNDEANGSANANNSSENRPNQSNSSSENSPDEENGEDDLPERWHECDCPGEDEACISVSGDPRCGLPQESCEPDSNACPEGYSCTSTGGGDYSYVCEGGTEECFPSCDTWEDCPDDGQCHPQKGICRSLAHCQTCPEGYVCYAPESGVANIGAFCMKTGSRDVGESCQEPPDCETGVCDEGTCVENCRTNADCADDENCTGGCPKKDGCRPDGQICEVSCEPEETCVQESCLGPVCDSTADCDTGDCDFFPPIQGQFYPSPGHCQIPDDPQVERHCKPEEIHVLDSCARVDPCWEDHECENIYDECHGSMNLCVRDAEPLDE